MGEIRLKTAKRAQQAMNRTPYESESYPEVDAFLRHIGNLLNYCNEQFRKGYVVLSERTE